MASLRGICNEVFVKNRARSLAFLVFEANFKSISAEFAFERRHGVFN